MKKNTAYTTKVFYTILEGGGGGVRYFKTLALD
jgi:hypothetical protein